MQWNERRPRRKCAYCGKEMITDSVKNPRNKYCSKTCASMERYQKRYVGSRSGADDKPKSDKTKF